MGHSSASTLFCLHFKNISYSGQIPGYPLSMLPLILHHKAAPVHCAHNPACPAMRIVSLFILGFGDYGAYWCTMGAAHQNHSCEQLLTPTQTSTELSSTRHKRQTNLCQLSGKLDWRWLKMSVCVHFPFNIWCFAMSCLSSTCQAPYPMPLLSLSGPGLMTVILRLTDSEFRLPDILISFL